VDWPFSMVLGLAVSDAVGAAGGGGGGGGGGATFFLQAPSVRTMPNANTSTIHFFWLCFTSSSLENKRARRAGAQSQICGFRKKFPPECPPDQKSYLKNSVNLISNSSSARNCCRKSSVAAAACRPPAWSISLPARCGWTEIPGAGCRATRKGSRCALRHG